jgi:hypothetical protein
MTRSLSVRLSELDVYADQQRAILATLPNRFHITSDEADVHVLAGPGDEMASEAATLASAGAVPYLATPAHLSVDQLDAIIAAAGDRPMGFALAGAPSLPTATLEALRWDDEQPPFIVDCVGETRKRGAGALRTALLEQLMLLIEIAGPVTSLEALHISARQVIVTARLASNWTGARLTARLSHRESLSLHAISRIMRLRVEILPYPHAVPARVTLYDLDGARTPAPLYQGGYRRSWIDLHDAACGLPSASTSSTLAKLHAAVGLMTAVLGDGRAARSEACCRADHY